MGTKPGMAKPEDADKRSYGMRSVSALVPKIARPVFQKRAPASAQLLADWDSIVGPELAAVSYAKRFAAGTLTIACTGVVALELQHRADLLRARINGALGRTLVERLRFAQEAPRAAATAPVRIAAKEPLSLAGSGLPSGPLRDALEALGTTMGARPRPR